MSTVTVTGVGKKPKIVYYKGFTITLYYFLGTTISRKGYAKLNSEFCGNWRKQLKYAKKYIDRSSRLVRDSIFDLTDDQLRRLCYNPGMFKQVPKKG